MPELPEVETMRRGAAAAVGSRIDDFQMLRTAKKPILVQPKPAVFRRRVVGKTIRDVQRLGKRVIVRLDGGDAIVLEPRMTGLVLVAQPPTVEHLRVRLLLSGGTADELLYWDRRGLGSVRLLSASQLDALSAGGKLGPDALALTAAALRERLKASRRAIKVGLLDQRAIAGIGNLYASEILHLAGIDPRRRCDLLSAEQWARLHAAMLHVLAEAIAYEGSTLSDGTYRNALNQSGGYQHHHRVYARAGSTCPTCGRQPIERIVQAQRSTFFCPGCQLRRPFKRNRAPR